MADIESRLKDLGLTLPEAAAPVANYVPYAQSGQTVHISGQISLGPDGLVTGRLGDGVSLEDGQAAARLCALNLIAQIKAACGGDLGKVKRIVKLGGFVNAHPDFYDIPKVINGASDLMVEVFGDAGRHARSAVGVAVLPLNAAVEVDAVVEIA
ncbi:MAG: RidA family protein [Oceanicaulis sp.]|jgi:enamine deaminase RidA (YjgF/YER057c/UK114 family)|uniref:RidA family protein n=1 Tax=Oceanicaulis TaxID=153232 RepID=UPI0003B692DD|nr:MULTISPECIES: RidA family protein [Oceanicaulis]MAP49077.1 RidA family protein [Oceanicaulis sp.]MBL4537488.1 RidA family protein [Oceanicaulis sp.]HCR65305.1 RidA family protein [Oceanicaulis sp.]|tara:strand:+ start:7017 stop:7478 length:462 start_codon:yes stop_codon:yes gene_type:complete